MRPKRARGRGLDQQLTDAAVVARAVPLAVPHFNSICTSYAQQIMRSTLHTQAMPHAAILAVATQRQRTCLAAVGAVALAAAAGAGPVGRGVGVLHLFMIAVLQAPVKLGSMSCSELADTVSICVLHLLVVAVLSRHLGRWVSSLGRVSAGSSQNSSCSGTWQNEQPGRFKACGCWRFAQRRHAGAEPGR